MKKWLTKSIARKIGSLVVLALAGILLIITISSSFFGKISEISSLTEVGYAYRVAFYQSVASYEEYIAKEEPGAHKKFMEATSFMERKCGAIVKLHGFLSQHNSVEKAVEAYGREFSGKDFDKKTATSAARLIHTLNGNPIQAEFVAVGTNNLKQATRLKELMGQYNAPGADSSKKKALQQEIKTIIPVLDKLSLETIRVFKAAATYLIGYVKKIFYILVGVIILTLGLVSFFIIRSITRPLGKTVGFAEEMAKGDMTTSLSISNRDELGLMAKALNTMTESLSAMMGDMKSGITQLGDSSGSLFEISEQLTTLSGQTSDKSDQVTNSAVTMNTNMNSVAAAMEESTTNISLVSAATEEMSSTINEIAKNAEQARQVSSEAVGQARNASEKMKDLDSAAKNIGRITETITDISNQTNLLALNATIEAARAGEAGKGFAVVANEIKELASQTASATADITSQISEVQNSTQTTTTQITQVTQVIDTINDIVATIATAVEEQSAVTREISGNIHQVAEGINEVNTTVADSSDTLSHITKEIGDVNQASSQVASNSQKVREKADDLSGLSGRLQQMIEQFKVN